MRFQGQKIKSNKTRRTFLKSTGAFVAGLGISRPIFAAFGKNLWVPGLSAKTKDFSIIPLQEDGILPEGVKAVWDLSKAFKESSPTRERICINGLWQWQPGEQTEDNVPNDNWGYFKVPGSWPGITNYMQQESQTLYLHANWKDVSLRSIDVAWYQREITIPQEWVNRRIILSSEYVNSNAEIFIDGKSAGKILFPAGELDITALCKPGHKHILSMKVTALPLSDVVAIFSDSNASRQGKGQVARRGLCGDVFLHSLPPKECIKDVQVITSFRKKEITFKVWMDQLREGKEYTLQVAVSHEGNPERTFKSHTFMADTLEDQCLTFTSQWMPDRLWDIHTPENMYDCTVTMSGSKNIPLDITFTHRFGYRELWIDGRDFYLNGKRIYLSAVPIDNALVGAALANYDAAKESMLRLMSFGINFVYTHNYGCEPGMHIGYEEVLRAADDTGMLISLSQPHFGQYEWQEKNADRRNGYAHHASFYTKVAGNHPSVVFYSMSHNACGYTDDMNPDRIDGLSRPASEWSDNNAKKAVRAEAIVAGIDESRIIYHHSSGNLSAMHTSNFYPNWVPLQEMTDWFEHWATEGVKPLFVCEYAAPFSWDWGLYRGWYKGTREFGSAPVPWEFCLAEWNAQFLGDEAYDISEYEKANLRWEAEKFRNGEVWHRWDYPYNFNNRLLTERVPVLLKHLTDQWRAFRTWGMSANSPWDYSSYWKFLGESTEEIKNLQVDWEQLQRPGFSADFIERKSRMDLDVAFDRDDWVPTAAKALERNNMPLLAYIAGKTGAFTSKDHNFFAGDTIDKQLVIINNSRVDITCDCKWSLNLPDPVSGRTSIGLKTGQQERFPLNIEIPESLPAGTYVLDASFSFNTGESQEDSFEIHILPQPDQAVPAPKTALFDPRGETRALLDDMQVAYSLVEAGTSLENFDVLIIGKEAMTLDGPGMDLEKVRSGLKVVVFEQSRDVLEKRFGFRVLNYGLRNVFARIPDHPLLKGLDTDHLCDWQGASTINPSKLEYNTDPDLFNGVPTVQWCDIPVTKIWRCGNRGNVASVLIEKPAAGDFLPIVDGGYSLQYSPMMEYKEGDGMVLFCQMDVTGRTEQDPAARTIVQNIVAYMEAWKPAARKSALYAGDNAGYKHLQKSGFQVTFFEKGKPGKDQLLIAGPGSGTVLQSESKKIKKWLKKGGSLIALGMTREDADALLPFRVIMEPEEHIATWFAPFSNGSYFAGIGPQDVHNREPKEFALIKDGAQQIGNGILASAENLQVVFCQLKPWENDYGEGKHNVKQTYRRSSFMLSRLVSNLGTESTTPLLARFSSSVDPEGDEQRWLDGLYLDEPEEWDYPYRFFRW